MNNKNNPSKPLYYASEDGNRMLIDKVRKMAWRPTERLREGRIRKEFEAELLQDMQLMTEVITRLYVRLREVEKMLHSMTGGEFKPLTPEVIDVENEFLKELLSRLFSGWISDTDSPEFADIQSVTYDRPEDSTEGETS